MSQIPGTAASHSRATARIEISVECERLPPGFTSDVKNQCPASSPEEVGSFCARKPDAKYVGHTLGSHVQLLNSDWVNVFKLFPVLPSRLPEVSGLLRIEPELG